MIMVLAGTSDGREIVKTLASHGYRVLACAATPYGASLLEGSGALRVSGRRLSGAEIGRVIEENKVEILVDATHPYAVEVSATASEVCREKRVRYIRYQRPASPIKEHSLVFYVKSYQEAAVKAAELGEVIFLATGSKTLDVFWEAAKKRGRRVIARVLPHPDVLKKCLDLGLTPADIVAIQGPFSREVNLALLRHYNAGVLVTKDGGARGGA
ncbi:MAG: precorrin-6A/cobalt-precorrin-6A reductase, partial [Thermoanaerobacter sp.]|nr:precorrin-6A/cobalt-precorrin-6A reductase [Thermoanaerobacter sp.]